MLFGAVLLALSIGVLPWELFEAMQRRMAVGSGQPMPEIPANVRTALRIGSIVGGGLAFIIFSFFGAALSTFIYAFLLGDEGKYRQYLAVGVHAAVIPAVVALLLAPMRIAAGDPQLTINLGTFLPFLPSGYIAGVLQAIDLSQIWSAFVAAYGIHAIDKRRSVASAARIQLSIVLVIALIAGWFLAAQAGP
jgi:hypothetical protein